jgi:CRISPR-associated protein Cas5t
MRVLKVVLEGITTSFRYPHFMMSVQPSFPMPPPATIYGHICSTIGNWVDPTELAFAYHFTAQEGVEDLEHIHVLSASTGKLPGSQRPKVLEGNVNPYRRAVLFQPRLVLYLNRPEWESAFRRPHYAVVLGRSQDLMTYTSISVIDFIPSEQVYFEHTILPYGMATRTSVGIVTLMPRWIDYERNRQPQFARYLILQRRIKSSELIQFDAEQNSYLADPTAPEVKGVPLGLIFHTFRGEDYETLTLA